MDRCDDPPLDFDHLAALARQDPQAFEAQRTQRIDTAIGRAPARIQQRLRCLQWKIDCIRDTAGSPMGACLRINRLLWDSLAGEDGLRHRLCREYPFAVTPSRRRAKILPFTR